MNSPFPLIGYVPYMNDMMHPGNRRRFPYFAKRKNIPFKIANTKEAFDYILLTGQSNLSEWLNYKKRNPHTKFIFEMTDSTIFPSDPIRTLLKGPGRYLLGKEENFYLDYKTPVRKWLRMADLVICSSSAVQKKVSKWNSNSVISLDYLESEYRHLKNDFSSRKKLKLVWEGLGVSLHHLWKFKSVFGAVSDFCELHIITKDSFTVWGNFYKKDVKKMLSQLSIDTVFHDWNIDTKDQILADCDLGIIPLNNRNLFAWHKPANKLISFWFCGLPTLVSNTPAYTEFMDAAMNELENPAEIPPFYCANNQEWIEKIRFYFEMKSSEREKISLQNYEFVNTHYSDESLDKVWETIWEKVGLKLPEYELFS